MQRITANRGFTTIELLITMVIAALLMTLAVPSMRDIIERSAVSTHINTFLGTIRYARSEAIRASAPVVICRSTDSEAASPSCAAAGDWAGGWIVFVNRDRDAANAFNPAAGDTLLRAQPAFSNSGGITSNASTAVSKLIFGPTGVMTAGASRFTFEARSLETKQKKLICVSMQGRARISTGTTCGDTDS
jgi:type IV fimbrial biogenesis protein FimT